MKNSTFLKDLFAIDKANDELFRLVGVAICMAIPLLIGYFSNNLLIGTFGSMGIYTFIYYQPLPLPQLLRRLNIVGFFIVLGNSLGMLSHHVPWLIPITIAIVAFLARLLFRLYGIEKPGALLVIMSTAMGTSNNFPLHKIPIMASFVLLGVVTGIIMGIVLHFIDKRPYVFQKRMSLQERLYIDPASLLDALHYAAILFLAAYLSQSLHLVNAYWMTFTCAAILQGENLHSVMQRILEVLSGIPNLVVMILMLTVFDPGIVSIVLAMVITNWISMARIVRAQTMKLKDQEFVMAAETLGESRWKIAIKHILPNISSVIIVQMMFSIPSAIFFEAFLSFIGLGLRPPTASLGTLLNEGYKTFRFLPYLMWIPAATLSVIMICFNLLADGLRDAFDPKMKE